MSGKKMKPNACIKHDDQGQLRVVENWKMDGSRQFRMQCCVCGKQGEKRRTFYGAIQAWNAENKPKEPTNDHD